MSIERNYGLDMWFKHDDQEQTDNWVIGQLQFV